MIDGTAGARLRSFIERLENLDEQRRDLTTTIADVFAEAKGEGFDVGTMRKVLKLRKMKPHKRAEAEELLDVYVAALGMAP